MADSNEEEKKPASKELVKKDDDIFTMVKVVENTKPAK